MDKKNKKVRSKRTVVLLADKIKILNRIRDGEKELSLAKSLHLHVNTIRQIKKNETKIRKSIAEGYSNCASVSRIRDINLVKMEKALMVWFEDCTKKKMPISRYMIKEKALRIYRYLKQMNNSLAEQPSLGFTASNGWLHRLQRRCSISNIKLQGEQASANIESAHRFTQKIQEIIETGGYTADQIFNADETGLYWKKLPSRTYIYQRRAPDFKASKERITLLMCSNVEGNYLLKPLVVHRSTHPRVFRNEDMSDLPVFWKNNGKAWMTANIFKEWFYDCFVPSVENHMLKHNLSFKALLIVDNATCHVKELEHPNVKVIFLPPDCTSLIQPLDQGIIHAFKTIYLRLSYKTICDRLDKDKSKVFEEAWKEFNIKDCIDIVSLACKEMKSSTLNACWKPLLPQMVKNGNIIPPADEQYSGIINLVSHINGAELSDINTQDVQELLQEESLNEKELIESIDQSTNDNMITDDNVPPSINLNDIEKVINLLKEIELHISEFDPSINRSGKFRRDLQQMALSYQELLAEEQNKNPDNFVEIQSDMSSVSFISNQDNLVEIQSDMTLESVINNQHITSNIVDYSKPLKKRGITW